METHPATSKVLPVVLAGGSGTRLWPLSRERHPKQFLRLVGESTLLQQTLSRLALLHCHDPFVVCNEEHRFIVAEQSRECGIDTGAIVLEPDGRNTAPAAALAAFKATAEGADPVLVVLPADHYIANEAAFSAAVGRAIQIAENGSIVVFGIPPSHPATGYGYVKASEETLDRQVKGAPTAFRRRLERRRRPTDKKTNADPASDGAAASVAMFTEKPTRAVAERYLAQGDWYWNSGMFVVRASVYLDELKAYRPDIHEACVAAAATRQDDTGWHRAGDAFLRCPAESIDRAVMEKTRRGVVVPTDMGWSDIGTWGSLAEVLPWDKSDHYPWGYAETLQSGDGFRLVRMTLSPGKALSRRMRGSSHWVVVRGLAEVAGEVRLALAADASTHIPGGVRHRLTNAGEDALVVIEVQTGSQRSEDDIVRFDDPFARD